jgi:hypothetical protein
MTVERKLMVDIEDIKAVCFECSKADCKTRITRSLGTHFIIPTFCPECQTSWVIPHKRDLEESQLPPHQLIKTILDFKKLTGPLPYRILLEFEEPKL